MRKKTTDSSGNSFIADGRAAIAGTHRAARHIARRRAVSKKRAIIETFVLACIRMNLAPGCRQNPPAGRQTRRRRTSRLKTVLTGTNSPARRKTWLALYLREPDIYNK